MWVPGVVRILDPPSHDKVGCPVHCGVPDMSMLKNGELSDGYSPCEVTLKAAVGEFAFELYWLLTGRGSKRKNVRSIVWIRRLLVLDWRVRMWCITLDLGVLVLLRVICRWRLAVRPL